MAVVVAVERYPAKEPVKDSVYVAAKWLRKNTPAFYPKISGYSNAKTLSDEEWFKVEMKCLICGYCWEKVKVFFDKFIDRKDVKENFAP